MKIKSLLDRAWNSKGMIASIITDHGIEERTVVGRKSFYYWGEKIILTLDRPLMGTTSNTYTVDRTNVGRVSFHKPKRAVWNGVVESG